MLLTACAMRSQDTTDVRPVVFPFWIVQQIALDLQEKSRLEAREGILLLELSKYKELTAGLEKSGGERELQLHLLQKENRLLQSGLALPQATRTAEEFRAGLSQILSLISALGAGYLLGKL